MRFLIRLIHKSWIKDNISIIILVPTFLGGMWQIIELASIGTPFIRFFSASQLVSDGLLILFIFAWCYLMWKLTSWDSKKQQEVLVEVETEQSTQKGIFLRIQQEQQPNKTNGYLIGFGLLIILALASYFSWLPGKIRGFYS